MAAETNSKGHLVKAGFKKATTWGTPVAVGSGDGLYLLRESIALGAPRIDDNSVGGSAQQRGADISAQTVAGTIEAPMRYEGRLNTMIALLFGTAGAPTGANPYVHTFKIKDSLSALIGTLVLDKQVASAGVTTWEYDTVAVESMTIKSTAGSGEAARASITLELIGRTMNRTSVTNGATQITALTFPTAGHLLHHNLTVRMKTNAAGTLGVGDVLKVKTFELTFRNNLSKGLFYSGSAYLDQPDRENFVDVTGSILLDKYSLDTPGVTEFLAGTYMMMDAEWTTGASAKFHFDFPYLQIIGGQRDLSGAGLIANPIPFKAFKPAAAPTGMTATDLVWLTLTNTNATDYLS
jgi:hypothetical protein